MKQISAGRKFRFRTAFAILVFFLMLFPQYNHAAVSNAVCYTMTPSLTKAAYDYLDEIYVQKYPAMALRTGRYGTDEDKANLQKLADLITKGAGNNTKKVKAVIDWALANIEYDVNTSAYPAQVFYTRKGSCFGYSNLIVELLRMEGIPAVLVEGWRGDMKMLTHRKLHKELAGDGHAWFFARLGGQWVMFDPLFTDSKPLTDRNFIASWYFFRTIEGISVTYPGMDLSLTGFSAYVYQDGRFMSINNGKTYTGNSNIMINDISFVANTWTENCGLAYTDPSRTTDGMKEGEIFRDGWFSYCGMGIYYAYENGIQAHGTCMTYQGKDYYFSQGSTYRILAPKGSWWISEGCFTVAPGFTGKALIPSAVEWALDDPDYRFTCKAADFGDVNAGKVSADGTFTALSPGYFQIEYENIRLEDNALMSIGFIEIHVSNEKPVPNYTFKKAESVKDGIIEEDSPKSGTKKTRMKAGTVFTDSSSNGKYKVLKGARTVEFVKMAKTAASLRIPTTVSRDGFSYKVVSVASGACKGNKKLKSLKIGANVSKIRAKAFYGCGKLKTITIQTKKLKASSVGASAFGKGYAKVKVSVPKNCGKSYKKILQKKGLGKKATVKEKKQV